MRTTEKFIVLDVETANDTVDALTYDIGFIVADRKGNIYERYSFCVYDIYCCEKDLMQSAYYAKKLPLYEEGLKNGEYKLAKFSTVKSLIWKLMKEYNISKVFAYNCNFDRNALTKTQRWLTKSKYRYFFPKEIEICDTLKMARDVIAKMPTYKRFCEENGYIGKNHQVSLKAEVLYRFISKDFDFVESHTGLEDVEIELEIYKYCIKQHKPMRKKLYE